MYHDVLAGRGAAIRLLPGNVAFRRLVSIHRDAFAKTSTRGEKESIARSIFTMVQARGGRFVEKSEAGLVEMTQLSAVIKFRQALRERKWKENRKTQLS